MAKKDVLLLHNYNEDTIFDKKILKTELKFCGARNAYGIGEEQPTHPAAAPGPYIALV